MVASPTPTMPMSADSTRVTWRSLAARDSAAALIQPAVPPPRTTTLVMREILALMERTRRAGHYAWPPRWTATLERHRSAQQPVAAGVRPAVERAVDHLLREALPGISFGDAQRIRKVLHRKIEVQALGGVPDDARTHGCIPRDPHAIADVVIERAHVVIAYVGSPLVLWHHVGLVHREQRLGRARIDVAIEVGNARQALRYVIELLDHACRRYGGPLKGALERHLPGVDTHSGERYQDEVVFQAIAEHVIVDGAVEVRMGGIEATVVLIAQLGIEEPEGAGEQVVTVAQPHFEELEAGRHGAALASAGALLETALVLAVDGQIVAQRIVHAQTLCGLAVTRALGT